MQYWFDFAATTCWVVARNLHMELHGPRKRSVPRSRRRDAACRTVCYLIAWKLRRLDDLRTTDELDFLDPCFVRTRRALIRALSDIYVYCSLLWGWESCIFCTRRYIRFSTIVTIRSLNHSGRVDDWWILRNSIFSNWLAKRGRFLFDRFEVRKVLDVVVLFCITTNEGNEMDWKSSNWGREYSFIYTGRAVKNKFKKKVYIL